MIQRKWMVGLLVTSAMIGFGLTTATAGDWPQTGAFKRALVTSLNGFEEVPALLTEAEGVFRAAVDRDNQSLEFVLRYQGLTSPVTGAHIHVGQQGVNGGVAVFLCGSVDTTECPEPGEQLTGVITADDVTGGAAAQGIAEGDLRGLLMAMGAGVTYVNVHTELHPTGEIRGQLGQRTIRSLFPQSGVRP